MKLYYMPGACSLAPHITAHEAGISLELIKVEDGKLPDGSDYLAVNPKGYVPALRLEDGSLLTEGPAITQYLADRKPDSELVPKWGTMERYRVLEWQVFLGSELHKQFAPLFQGGSKEAQKDAGQKILKRLEYIAGQLEGKLYLMGATFTVADAYLFVILNWAHKVKLDFSQWPALVEYHARVAARPKVREAMEHEGLLTATK